jgi:hypothetical protein
MIETRDIPLEETAKYCNVEEAVLNGSVATKRGKVVAAEISKATVNMAEKNGIAMKPKKKYLH